MMRNLKPSVLREAGQGLLIQYYTGPICPTPVSYLGIHMQHKRDMDMWMSRNQLAELQNRVIIEWKSNLSNKLTTAHFTLYRREINGSLSKLTVRRYHFVFVYTEYANSSIHNPKCVQPVGMGKESALYCPVLVVAYHETYFASS